MGAGGMRILMCSVLIAGVSVIGCGRGDNAPAEIVIRVKMDDYDRSRGLISAMRAVIGMFHTPLDLYKLDVGCLPTTVDGLQALRAKPSDVDVSKWQGPYLEKDVPRDLWDHELRYECPGKHNPDSYDVWSPGPDGVDGTDDDIGNW
jgi:type II secretion system protein G